MPIESEDPQKQQRGKQASFRFVSGESGTDGVSNRMYGAPASSTAAARTGAVSNRMYGGPASNTTAVQKPAYNTLQSNGSVAETSMGTDGVSNRMYGATAAAASPSRNATARRKAKTATNTVDAGATLTAMSLRQKVTMYKRVAAGLAMLSFVLLIGLIVVSTAGNGSVGICADTTSATEALAGAETAASADFAASAANATSAAPVAASPPATSTATTTTETVTTRTTTTYDWEEEADRWRQNATQCSANLDAAGTLATANGECCTELQQFEDLAVGAQCRAGSECSGGRQCLGRCCSDGAGTNCIVCGTDGRCAACSPDFYLHPGSGACTSKLKDGEEGCSTAAECASGRACRGSVCCNEHGAAAGVVKCSTGSSSAAGAASECSPGLYLDGGQCVAAKAAGKTCAADHECLLGGCRGSVCCTGGGQSAGCTACASGSGNCQQCATSLSLSQAGFCAPPPPPPTSCPACPSCPSCPAPPPPPPPKSGGCGDQRIEYAIPIGTSGGGSNIQLYGGLCDSMVYCSGVPDGGTCKQSIQNKYDPSNARPCHELTGIELTEPKGEHPSNPHCGTLREFTANGCTHQLRKHRYCTVYAKCYGGKVVASGYTW